MTIGHTSAQMALRDPDIRLMLRVRDDDPAAFAELVGNYQHRLVGIMHGCLKTETTYDEHTAWHHHTKAAA